MIIVMKNNTAQEQIRKVVEWIESIGYKAHLSQGVERTLIGAILEEAASTRLLVYTATLIHGGYDPLEACRAALVEPLSDDEETTAALMEVVDVTFGQ